MTAVYSYWTGPQPVWIGLCLETLRRNCPAARILDATWWTSGEYDGPIPADVVLAQRPNVQSDYLRAWLLQRETAVWVDADCIVWRDLRPIADHLQGHDFVAYRSAHQLCSALIAGDPASEIGWRYLEIMTAKLQAGRRLRPLELGPAVLGQAIRQSPRADCYLIPSELCHPLHWTARAQMRRRNPPAVAAGAYTWMMGHRWLKFIRGADRETILASPSWAGQLFRQALGVTTDN